MARAAASRREATVNKNGVRCRDYVCEHGVSQSTCKCVGVKEVVPISCATTCPGRVKTKGKRRGK